MDRWDDLRFLAAVAQAGNMSAAARKLGANVGTVSRRIERLSEDLGVTIFLKTPDGWQPNPVVAGLIDATVEFQSRLTKELNRRRMDAGEETVSFRMMAPPVFTSNILVPGLPVLQDMAPKLQISFSPGLCATALGENDAIITARLPERGRLMSRRVCTLDFGLYRTPANDTSEDWAGLLPEYDETPPMQMALAYFECPPLLRMGSLSALAEAMTSSGLPGPLPCLIADKNGDLVRLEGEKIKLKQDLHFCYHETRRGDPAIDTVMRWIDYCVERYNPTNS